MFSAVGLAKLRPWMGAVARALSSFTVCRNALRLNLISLDKDGKKKPRLPLPSALNRKKRGEEEKTLSHKERKVEDRRCSHCVNKITETLSSIDGVYHVHVDLETKLAGFDLTKDVPDSKLLEAVKEAGYTPEMIQK